MGDNPWLAGEGDRGADYQARLEAKAAEGAYLHGEADLVADQLGSSVLDAGCGTGRVAVELASRGWTVTGVDLDPSMLAVARGLSDAVTWVESDLGSLQLGRTFDVVLAAGNVMIFLTPGTGPAVVERLAAHLAPQGTLIAGFALDGGPGGTELELAEYDRWCAAAGLRPVARLATWEGAPYRGGPYAVSLHRPIATPAPPPATVPPTTQPHL